MAEIADAKKFGLTPRTCLERESEDHLVLIIDRKSRLIMADGRRITEKVNKIRSVQSGCKVSVKTNAPVCSKTRAFLSEKGINIM